MIITASVVGLLALLMSAALAFLLLFHLGGREEFVETLGVDRVRLGKADAHPPQGARGGRFHNLHHVGLILHTI